MTHHDLHYQQHAGHDELAAWVDHQKHEILARIDHVRAAIEQTHSDHPSVAEWKAIEPTYKEIAPLAGAVVRHLTEIGHTDVPAYHVFEQVVHEANNADGFGYFEEFASHSLLEGVTDGLNKCAALLYSI